MPTLHFKIVTPERVVYEADADSVTLPTTTGQITVLPHHRPLVSQLAPGELVVRSGVTELPLVVSGGFIEVRPGDQVAVLADTAEHIQEIDEQRAQEARRRAAELRQQQVLDETEFASLSAKIEKELARLHVARKYRHRIHPPGGEATFEHEGEEKV